MRAAPGFMGRVARVPVMHARRCLLCAACIAVCVAGARGEDGSASPGPPPPSPGTSYSEGPILRTVVSVGIIAFALMALYGCWMRHRDDSVEMDRRRAERERHLDSALGEHLHLGQRESRRLARTEGVASSDCDAYSALRRHCRDASSSSSDVLWVEARAGSYKVGSFTCP